MISTGEYHLAMKMKRKKQDRKEKSLIIYEWYKFSMKCIKCNKELEENANFCPFCGDWTSNGYIKIKNDTNEYVNGPVNKQDKKFRLLLSTFVFLIITYFAIVNIRKIDIFKPYVNIKKQIKTLYNGYKSSIIKVDNYYLEEVEDEISAKILIKNDINSQKWQCNTNYDVSNLEYKLENNYNILSVSFCDMNTEISEEISNVIIKMYELFPIISNNLTNVTVSNLEKNNLAMFKPIHSINKNVNKTEVILNGYYFLNDSILNNSINDIIKEDWYVKDATYSSILAHELGHLVSYSILLKNLNIDQTFYLTPEKTDALINQINNSNHAEEIVNKAYNNYILKNDYISLDEFVNNISKYASYKVKGKYIFDEIIAESIHDYYLHGKNLNNSSKEIILLIKGEIWKNV